MSIALAAWGLDLEGGESTKYTPAQDIKITNVALADVLADEKGRTVLKLSIPLLSPEDDEDMNEDDDEPKLQTVTICSFTPGKIEQAHTELILLEDEDYKFEVVGKNKISLAGYYIDQGMNQPPDYDSDGSEDEHDLRFVSSDVEMDPNELDSDASRFEEVDEEEEKSLKRPRASEASTEAAKPLSKAEKKKNKKQKLQDGTAAASGDDTQPAKTDDKKEKKEKKDHPVKELPSGLKIKDAKIGTGPMAKKGQTIGMRYIGKLANGKKFDSNTTGKPFTFRLGASEVIKGWDEGIAGMQVGGERILTVPPALGYGKRGSPPEIPGNATLIFEVKCLSIK
ncbi:hypothetical protein BT96DRAFT_968830 [Gymnopus androsaceus JB14]|uniref:peptidylprolyl isomerase n=1 Tax=Gymnopus androsaceus JB14 TaxID=1447944 RepID=A0A6A4IRU8_9AGAR|nr:hypothetical protein BT96DRAFT_968830 [Gymnopus androsaceus JB14]